MSVLSVPIPTGPVEDSRLSDIPDAARAAISPQRASRVSEIAARRATDSLHFADQNISSATSSMAPVKGATAADFEAPLTALRARLAAKATAQGHLRGSLIGMPQASAAIPAAPGSIVEHYTLKVSPALKAAGVQLHSPREVESTDRHLAATPRDQPKMSPIFGQKLNEYAAIREAERAKHLAKQEKLKEQASHLSQVLGRTPRPTYATPRRVEPTRQVPDEIEEQAARLKELRKEMRKLEKALEEARALSPSKHAPEKVRKRESFVHDTGDEYHRYYKGKGKGFLKGRHEEFSDEDESDDQEDRHRQSSVPRRRSFTKGRPSSGKGVERRSSMNAGKGRPSTVATPAAPSRQSLHPTEAARAKARKSVRVVEKEESSVPQRSSKEAAWAKAEAENRQSPTEVAKSPSELGTSKDEASDIRPGASKDGPSDIRPGASKDGPPHEGTSQTAAEEPVVSHRSLPASTGESKPSQSEMMSAQRSMPASSGSGKTSQFLQPKISDELRRSLVGAPEDQVRRVLSTAANRDAVRKELSTKSAAVRLSLKPSFTSEHLRRDKLDPTLVADGEEDEEEAFGKTRTLAD